MRIYTDAMQLIREVERDLWEMGTRYQTATVQDKHVENDPDYLTTELMGYAYTLVDLREDKLIEMINYLPTGNTVWARAELEERTKPVGGTQLNPGEAWKKADDIWRPFLRDGVFSYSYAERWQHQLPYVINELKRRPYTRQAMMTMYSTDRDMMNWGGRDRVPCSLSYQFMLREGKLNIIYNQRSCDFMKFFAHDVFFTVGLLKHVAEATGLPVGNFIHFIGSLHAFQKDLSSRGIF